MKWIFALVIFVVSFVQAQVEGPYRPEYLATSRMVTLRVVPKEKEAKLFFAGQKMAKLDFEKNHRLLEVTALKQNQSEKLQFAKEGDAYVVSNLPDWKEPYDLVVKSETKGKVENLRVHIKNQSLK